MDFSYDISTGSNSGARRDAYTKGYKASHEAIHMIRKGQACWSATGARVGLLHRFIVGMFGLKV
jgi:hypothetical protein